jgi:transcriptional regulator with XRE-family HTH domain
MPKEDIYKKIKERRALLGITQQDLADISGVALRTIKQIETGKGNPSINTLAKIADVLGMYIDLVIKNPINI